ncbi:hypothetical protein C5167_024527 [Papaver somniferum]|uniref:Uncharacterized protein n=1 Tax=Papaver somniferum TaxID=3469 RepID=A0A4Y7JSI5_PAPSO|nr:hypothetical protein C5167_024527 [Papaver somniferum]
MFGAYLAHWVLALSLFYLQEHMETTGTRFVNQRRNMTAEQMAIQRSMNRDRQSIHKQNMTEEQRSTVREHDRIRAAKEKLNLPSTATGNNAAHLFERVTQQNAQTEVEGYVELEPLTPGLYTKNTKLRNKRNCRRIARACYTGVYKRKGLG